MEYVSEHGGTFHEYLEFQVQQEEETPLTERQDNGGYLMRLREYLAKHEEYCTYCHTYGHEAPQCPDQPEE